jgi:hypothetical protein
MTGRLVTIRANDPDFVPMATPIEQRCEDESWGPVCTLRADHDGDHMAHANAIRIVARWSRDT